MESPGDRRGDCADQRLAGAGAAWRLRAGDPADYEPARAALPGGAAGAYRLQPRGEPVDLLDRVVVDEAEPDRLVFVPEALIQVERVPRIVRPDPDLPVGQRLRHFRC